MKTVAFKDSELCKWIRESVEKYGDIRFPPKNQIAEDTLLPFTFEELLKILLPDIQFKDKKIICPYSVNWLYYDEWSDQLHINGVIFQEDILWSPLYDVKIFIRMVNFCQRMDFSNYFYQKEMFFIKVEFLEGADFSDVIFHQKVKFDSINFYATTDFFYTKFHEKVEFSFTKFYDTVDFIEAIFHAECVFGGCLFQKDLGMDGIVMTPNSHLSFRDTKPCPLLKITNSVINGRLDFNGDAIKSLDLKGSVIIGTLNRIEFAPDPANWQTAVILKHEEMKRNNVIEALWYRAIEKSLYKKELGAQPAKNWQAWAEIFTLELSGFTNSHGQNWVQAVAVTVFCFWLLPFALFYLPVLGSANWLGEAGFSSGQFFVELLRYFIPINYALLEQYFINQNIPLITKFIGSGVYLLGKVLLPFGIFEVVQAFRKFNKSA